jgi:hypothetical protein
MASESFSDDFVLHSGRRPRLTQEMLDAMQRKNSGTYPRGSFMAERMAALDETPGDPAASVIRAASRRKPQS